MGAGKQIEQPRGGIPQRPPAATTPRAAALLRAAGAVGRSFRWGAVSQEALDVLSCWCVPWIGEVSMRTGRANAPEFGRKRALEDHERDPHDDEGRPKES